MKTPRIHWLAAGLAASFIVAASGRPALAVWPFGKSAETPADTAREETTEPDKQDTSRVNLKKLEKQANDGFANAQLVLGNLYLSGSNPQVKKDYKKAVEWFQKAAEPPAPKKKTDPVKPPSPIALFNLALCYEGGLGVAKNQAKAQELFLKSADMGTLEAQWNVAIEFERQGKLAEAFKYYRMAADQNPSAPHLGSVRKTAGFLLEGKGCAKNPGLAVKYLLLGAENSDPRAQVRLADCYQTANGVERDYNEMIRWLLAAAAANDTEAQAKIAYCYAQGMGVVADTRQAFLWFRKSAEAGYMPAQVMLGNLYMTGMGVEADTVKGAEWHRKAAARRDPAGMFSLGADYHLGRGVAADDRKAFELFEAAAKADYAPAQYNLGTFYEDGVTVPPNLEKAAELYGKAAVQNDPQAMSAYGSALLTGKGIAKNRELAREYLTKAALAGEKDARELLAGEFPDAQLPVENGQP